NGYSISGLYYNDSSNNFVGFVSRLAEKGVIKNLTIKNSYFNSAQYVGGITGSNKGQIINCHSSATVSGTSNVGGIAGYNDNIIANCSNSGKVTATSEYVGGIVGFNILTQSTINYCSNTGEVSGKDFIGGILGFGDQTPIINCYNTGNVNYTEEAVQAVGAIVGFNNSFYASVNCYYLEGSCIGGVFGIPNLSTSAEEVTMEQFKSGKVAYLLNSTDKTVWYQTLGTHDSPQFSGKKVYYGYDSCSTSAEKIYTNNRTVTPTKPEHIAKTPANCLDLAVCKNCSETYGKINANNHKSDETYSVYYDNSYHKDYHSCCNALIGSCSHNIGKAATCTSQAYCSQCNKYYGNLNPENHSGNFKWIDNGYDGYGTHSRQWECCGVLEEEAHNHNFTFTADEENNIISGHCNDCGYEGSLYWTKCEDDIIYDHIYQGPTLEGEIWGANFDVEHYKNGDLTYGSIDDAGEYVLVLKMGGKSVSVEFEIKKRELKVESLYVIGKTFDGTNEIKVDNLYFDYYFGGDDVKINCENAVAYAPSNRVGDYSTVSGLKGVVIEGRDKNNYIIPEISEDIEYNANYSIYPYDITITPEHQYITDESKFDTTKFTVDTTLPKGYTLEGMAVVMEGEQDIYVDTSNAKVMYGDEDYTDCFYFNTYAKASVIICCEGHVPNEEGFCSTGTCSAYEPAKLNDNGTPEDSYDDYYEISNVGQLYWFAKQVNGYYNTYIKVKLTADIDVNPGYTFNSDGTYTGGNSPRMWTPIGYADGYTPYTGIFDGNGHTISGLYINTPNDSYVGMFAGCDYGNTIKNVKLTNSYFSGKNYVGALAGYAGTTFSNCYADSTVTVNGNGYNIGGLVGELAYGTVSNSLCFANVVCEDGDQFIGHGYGEVVNCYYLAESEATTRTDAIAKTAEEFASGEIAWLLQDGVEEEYIYDEETDTETSFIPEIWGQDITTNANDSTKDSFPVLKGLKVYNTTNCKGESIYSNTNGIAHFEEVIKGTSATCKETGLTDGIKCSSCGETIKAQETIPATGKHNYENGVCTGCGNTEPTEPPTEKPTEKPTETPTEAPSIKTDGYYVTGDINLKLTPCGKGRLRGTIALQPGTYNIKLNDHGTLLGYKKTVNNSSNGLTFKKTFSSFVTLNATGGTYT
ncbi:MAG: PT domain-containing protein, partial [Acutalibacteraceae bacterium]|nr:PT domain-containing protein [Acutalibacteraceae bacterium]